MEYDRAYASKSKLAAAQMGYAGDTPQQVGAPSVTTHLERCMQLLNELAAQKDRIMMIADKVQGPVPATETGKGHLQPQACLVGSVEFLSRRLDELVADMSEELHRIEGALG